MTLLNVSKIHSGQKCVIIGAGPSVRHEDFSKRYSDEIYITVNSSIIAMPDSDYYVSDDQGILDWSYFNSHVVPFKGIRFFNRSRVHKLTKHMSRCLYYENKNWYDYHTNRYIQGGTRLTDRADGVICGGRTSVISAINIAYVMGCRDICLLGCDCIYENGFRYFWQFKDEKPICYKPHIHTARVKSKNPNHLTDWHCEQMLDCWKVFAEENRDKDINIFNGSNISYIENFPKLSLQEFLSK